MILSRHVIRRYVLQARTPIPVATTATAAAAEIAYAALQTASWRPAAAGTGSSNLPPHHWSQTGLEDSYDAAKFCGDFDSATMRQHAYACAADYVIKVPQSAITGEPCDLVSLMVRAHGDRWLADGAIIAAIPSNDVAPPAWDDILAAITSSPPILAVTPANDGADTTSDVTMSFPAATTATAYIHLVIRLADYTTVRGAWIEGSAMIAETSIAVEYSRDVSADPIAIPPVLPTRTIAFRSIPAVGQTIRWGGEHGMMWYSSTVPLPGDRSTPLNRESAVKAALSHFPYAEKVSISETPFDSSGAGLVFKSEAGGTVRVDGAAMAFYYHAQQPRTVSRFTILNGMPGLAETGWRNGLHIRWAIYHIQDAWETDEIAPSSLADLAFWRGVTDKVALRKDGVDRDVTVVIAASLIMPDGGYADGDTIPLRPTLLTTRGTILMVWYPEDVSDHDVGATTGTFYGIDFSGGGRPAAVYLE